MKITYTIPTNYDNYSVARQDNLYRGERSCGKNIFSKSVLSKLMPILINNGCYFALPADPSFDITGFTGWFSLLEGINGKEYSLYKSLSGIYLFKGNLDTQFNTRLDTQEISDSKVYVPEEVIVHHDSSLGGFERIYSCARELFTLLDNGLVYDLNINESSPEYINSYLEMELDFRDIYDHDDKGRIYKSYNLESDDCELKNTIVVEYTKYCDDSLSQVAGQYFMLIKIIRTGEQSLPVSSLLVSSLQVPQVSFGEDKNKVRVIDKWVKKEYSYDYLRGDPSSKSYVYDYLRIKAEPMRILFSFAASMDKAVLMLKSLISGSRSIARIKNSTGDIIGDSTGDSTDDRKINEITNEIKCKSDDTSGNTSGNKSDSATFVQAKNQIKNRTKNALEIFGDSNLKAAYIESVSNLNRMLVNMESREMRGLWAGLPWFFQYWARDELISLKALMLEDDGSSISIIKEILMRHLNNILPDGRLPSLFPKTPLGNADSIGWLFKRIHEIFMMLSEKNMLDSYFSLYDIKFIHERLRYSISHIMQNYFKEGLMHNDRLETWMDTFFADDYREGSRIEIQALFLSMLRFMNYLDEMLVNRLVKKHDGLIRMESDGFDCISIENSLAARVREKFLKSCTQKCDGAFRETLFLSDGYNCSNSDVLRPNVFLAYYIYPRLLNYDEWIKVFDYALEKLWCEWDLGSEITNTKYYSEIGNSAGGLSTIDKSHPLFSPSYTGQDNKSYHRGDSWFFVNNLAAVSMIRLDKNKYSGFIKRIVNASCEDILYSGFLGCASEISSASSLDPGGCFSQTWSMATFIELMHELNGR